MFRFGSKGRTSSGLSETSSPTQETTSTPEHAQTNGSSSFKSSTPSGPTSVDKPFDDDGRWRQHSHDEQPADGLAPSLAPFRSVSSTGGGSSSGAGGSVYEEPSSLLSTPPLSLGSFDGPGSDENDSTANLATAGAARARASPARSSSSPHHVNASSGPSTKSDRYRSLGKKSPMSFLTASNGSAPEGSTSQLRLVSTPSPLSAAPPSSETSPTADVSQPTPHGGSATTRWLRRVASAPNTKLFGSALSFKNAPPSPSTAKAGFFTSSNGSDSLAPTPSHQPHEAIVSLSSDTESSTRSASGGKKSGGGRTLGVLGLGSSKTSSQSSSTGASVQPPTKNFRRTYSSNSIKLREVRRSGVVVPPSRSD
jgi:hypothetical protein